ncbi:MAG: DEAD/DEAH box helicase [Candidatus Abawacabacteria bacterium]|nr:DEAD/DEAH box helicase [Candidatus Abawacabacteria bacterium]
MSSVSSPNEFSTLPLSEALQNNLKRLQFTLATPIQHACIPAGLEGKDIIGIAQTGTGKTLAFGLPILQRLHGGNDRALIVVPTRELALQVEESLKKVASGLNLNFAVLIGGASMGGQKSDLRRNPQILIATPGRLIDHLKQRTVQLSQVATLVLDEADRMFDMGFAPQVEQILHALPDDRQTMLFSATMPDGIAQMVKKHMRLPVRIEIARQGSVADKLEQELFVVRGGAKPQLLEKLLTDYEGTVLVFTRTKHAAKRISTLVRSMGHSSAELHSNRSLGQRKQALQGFKTGRYRVLIATDIAARGIDVSDIELVINYDLPENPEDYVHRIGRTGRAGKSGKAVSFATPDQMFLLKRIERLTRARLPQSPLPTELPPSRQPPKDSAERGDDFRPSRERGGRRPFGDRGGRRSSFGDRNRDAVPFNNEWKPASLTTGDDKVMPRNVEGDASRGERPFRPRRNSFSQNKFGNSSDREFKPRRSGFSADRGNESDRGEGGFRPRRSGGFGQRSRGESTGSRSNYFSARSPSSERSEGGYTPRPRSDRPYSAQGGEGRGAGQSGGFRQNRSHANGTARFSRGSDARSGERKSFGFAPKRDGAKRDGFHSRTAPRRGIGRGQSQRAEGRSQK